MSPKPLHVLLCAVAPACFALSVAAQDAGGYYAKVFGGLSALQGDTIFLNGATTALSYDSGTSFGGALGYDYADSPYRAEVEFAYRSGDASDFPLALGSEGDFASTSLMVNGYYVFETGSDWLPYAGLGLGVITEVDFDFEGAGGAAEYNDRGGVAYQAILGVEYPLSKQFTVFAEARYFSAGSVTLETEAGGTLDADYDSFDINIGGAYRF